ncbi:hypothetical protein H4R26_001695 [Coemansia thaxteri]|uniref:Uncharacterized protein n=1 Tax=Coemansia thaxteri TaxID=2663907 RepID=A0A9W8EK88_9FUNG|nr:hypothetical protein H4R26_001695 [Coemansia thaxteri]
MSRHPLNTRGIGIGSATSSSVLYGASAEEKVVLDIGACSLRAGFSGDSAPLYSSTMANTYSLVGDSYLHALGSGTSASQRQKPWSEVELVEQLREVYRRDLLVDARTRKVAVVEGALQPTAMRLAVARVLLSNLQVPHVSFYPASVAALMTTGQVTGLVVDCGHHCTTITPVYEACALAPYLSVTPLAGVALFANLRALLKQHAGFIPHVAAESTIDIENVLTSQVVTHIMTRLLFASPIATPMALRADLGAADRHGDELLEFFESSSACTAAPRTKLTVESLKNGRGVLEWPSWIRERATEVLFCGDLAAEHLGIADTVAQCIARVPVDTRRALISRILVIGGVADVPGFRPRLLHDIATSLRCSSRWAALADDAALVDYATGGNAQVFAPSDRAWVGASIATSAKIGAVEIGREEFDGHALTDWTTIKQ